MDTDPWHWDAGEVEDFFRSDATNILLGTQGARLPRNSEFYQALRDEGVTGDCLLTAIDNTALREECGVSSAMARSAVLSCISRLKARSPAYAAKDNQMNFQSQTPRSLAPAQSSPTPAQPALDLAPPLAEEIDQGQAPGHNARSGEYQVQDAHGRKRRRLNLLRPEPDMNEEGGPKAKKEARPEQAEEYLRDIALSLDELFYGPTSFGEVVGALPTQGITVREDDREADLEDKNFQIQHIGKRRGEVELVYGRLRHLLNNAETVDLTRQGRDAVALLPYREGDSGMRSATVVQFTSHDGEQPVAFRENAAYLDSTVPEKHVEAGGEWDFLTSKYRNNDEDQILPRYGESETAPTDSRSTTKDSHADSMASESVAADEIGTEQASRFIDDVLEKYKIAWQDRRTTLEQKKAYSVWSKMKRSRTIRHNLIESARAQTKHLKVRLQKQKGWLLETQWRSASSLEKLCGNLRATVEDIEEQNWMIEVWGRKQEPYHVTRGSASRKDKHQHGRKEAAADRFVVPGHDRFSASSPPSLTEGEALHSAEDHGGIEPEENVYLADDEEFHTPVASPHFDRMSADAAVHDDGLVSNEEKDSTPFVVPDETSMHGDEAETPLNEGPHTDYDAKAESGADSEGLPTPSRLFASQVIKPEIKPATPAKNRIMSIDLTADSPSSEAPTPTTKKRKLKSTQIHSLTDNPDFATAQDIDDWQFSDLVRMMDRKRILMKIIRDARADQREQLHQCFVDLHRTGFTEQLGDTLQAMRGESLDSFDDEQGSILRLAAGIYLRYHHIDLLTTATPENVDWDSVLTRDQIHVFSSMLWDLLLKRNTAKFNKKNSAAQPGSSSANPHVLSSSDNERIASPRLSSPRLSSPRFSTKKRKREVQRSQVGQDARAKAAERARKLAEAESQPANSSQLAVITANGGGSLIEINPTKQDGEGSIYILDEIAKKMKPHQIKGARFLWLEVITSDEESGGRGCVLAHTMGLGKTMQTIAFLAAVNEAAQAKRKAVRHQLPKHLRAKEMRGARSIRVLILCPPGLIPNWKREIELWASKKLGHVFCLDSSVHVQRRLPLLKDWIEHGGVLIVGYQMFSSLVNPGTNKGRPRKIPLPDDEVAELESNLLDGPEIVVADEAHNLKNDKSAVSVGVSRFKTESRIALTGTPMSNDVQEIYSLVSWVSPNYLGDREEFRRTFAEPIKAGLYADSERYEQRRSIIRLKGLHEDIKEKVNRANIEALRGSIPPKVEFVIFVSLQPTQRELYRKYIQHVKGFIDANRTEDGVQKTSQVVFLSMLSVLTLLTNHPYCFKEKLLEPPKAKKKAVQDRQIESGDGDTDAGDRTPGSLDITTAEQLRDTEAAKVADAHVSAQGLTAESVTQILDGDGSDIGIDPELSSKLTVFMSLLQNSLDAGDKAVVFTQKLGLLDYLARLFTREGTLYGRIDGSDTSKRMTLLSQFENGDFDVMIVSTKAGGVGLNMQCANRVFIFDSGFNPTYEEQAIGRAYRLGQKQHVYVYRFVASGTFESNIYNKQLFKTSLAMRVVDKQNPRRNAERNTINYLYEPREVKQEDVMDNISKDPEVLGRLLQQHGTGNGKYDTLIRAVKTMETLTEEDLDEPLNDEEQKVVQQEVEARKQRPRGKKAAPAIMTPPSSMPTFSGFVPPNPRLSGGMPPPSSTFAGSSSRLQAHPLGGLPSSSREM